MVYFRKSYITFLKKLEVNNNPKWFLDNLSSFELNVYHPFRKLIVDMIEHIEVVDPSVKILPEEAIYENFRNKPFTAQTKMQYNTYMTAFISKFGKEILSYPGTYIRIDSRSIILRFGLLQCDQRSLERLRKRIVSDYETLEYLLNQRAFKSYFGKLVESKDGPLSPSHNDLITRYPLIANTNFYCEVTIDISLITAGKLLWLIMQHYRIAQPFVRYITKVVDADILNTLESNESRITGK